jgi:hypothetical protein
MMGLREPARHQDNGALGQENARSRSSLAGHIVAPPRGLQQRVFPRVCCVVPFPIFAAHLRSPELAIDPQPELPAELVTPQFADANVLLAASELAKV